MNKLNKFVIGLFFIGFLAIQISAKAQNSLPELPKSGLTPENSFYFLDQTGEKIEEFFTFNTKVKTKLQAKQALERIAEIKTMLDKKEVNPRGLDIALKQLQANITKTALIIQSKQQKGANVEILAKDTDIDFEIRLNLLEQIFEEKKEGLEQDSKTKEAELKKQFIEAKIAIDDVKINEANSALNKLEQEVKEKKLLLEQKEKSFKPIFKIEQKKIESALAEKEKELKLKKEELKFSIEQQKKELEKQFEEIKQSNEEKEKSLENQLDVAISLGKIQEIEDIKTKFLIPSDIEIENLKKMLKEQKQNFELLLLEKEQQFENLLK